MPPEEEKKSGGGGGDDIIFWIVVGIIFLAFIASASAGFYFSFLTTSINWRGIYNGIVVFFSVINAVLVSFFIFALWRMKKLDEFQFEHEKIIKPEIAPVEDEVADGWDRIEILAESENPSDWTMAVIQADALLDDVLQHLGYEGDSMGDRLKIVDPVQLPSLERIWVAHRLRNIIVHDPMTEHSKEKISEALRTYRDAFKELRVLKK